MNTLKNSPTVLSTSSPTGKVTKAVTKVIKTGQKHPAGLIGTIAMGSLFIAGWAIKAITDLVTKDRSGNM